MIGAQTSLWSDIYQRRAAGGIYSDATSLWLLDEASGTRADSIGSNDLTDNNTVGYANMGPSGTVASFTQASTEQLTHADNAGLSLAGAKTWVAWVRPANAGSTRPVFAKRDAGSVEYQLIVDSSNTLAAFVQDSVSGSSSFGGAAAAIVPAGAWSFCVWWYDPSDKKIHGHVNLGTEQLGSALTNGPIDGTQTFSIGESASAFWYGGDIARAGVWDRVVSLADLTTLYNAGKGKSYADLTGDELTGLVSYWNLDEASGARYDSHGSNDLTDNNTVGSATNSYPANLPGRVASFVAANSEYLSHADDAAWDLAGGKTWALWVKPGAAGTNRALVSQRTSGDGAWQAYINTSNNAQGYITDSTAGFSEPVDGAVAADSWHLYVFWYDPADKKMYISVDNGVASAGAALTNGPISGTHALNVGRLAGTIYTTGEFSTLVLWPKVLTSDERTELYNSGDGAPLP